MAEHRSCTDTPNYTEDTTRCARQIWSLDRKRFLHQCLHARGYGPRNAFCNQHAKLIKKEKRARAEAEARD